jgi:6-phosphogluconolactonase
VDWARVHVFWGDERCVPPDHAESNYRMAREALLDQVSIIPAQNVHRMRGEIDPEEAADGYETDLRACFGVSAPPRFDLILLGMGDDGHTASLFPGAEAIREQARWVAAYYVEKLGAWRLTLTPVVLNAAANVIFLVVGAGKAARLREVLDGPYQPDRLPAQVVRPSDGRLLWMVDQAASSERN